MSDLKIGVLGAGVVGLTTAIELQKEFRGAQISILADKFDTDTTSSVAAGLFRPGTNFCGPTEEITKKWIKNAYNYWDDIRCSSEAPLAGVIQLSGYMFSKTDPSIVKNHLIDNILPVYRSATDDELHLCPGDWKYGTFLTTIVTECRFYLPWARRIFLNNGGVVTQRKIERFGEIADDFDVIVNCTGLGAKYLCNDYKVVPMRGQVIKVKAPFLKTFFYDEYDTYVIPGIEAVTLGGCRQYDSYNLKICRYDSASIRERCERLVPSLKGAPVVRECVGLRPYRSEVRVEKEMVNIPCKGKNIKIVHNYGHGGYGVTTAPGTSLYAVELVRQMISGNSKL